MNAFELVDLLLEADQMSAGSRTGVYAFGPELPDKGYNAPDFDVLIQNFKRYGIIPKDSDGAQMLDDLTRVGYTFFLKKDPGNVEVIGPIPARTTPDGQKRAAQYLGLEKKAKVQYRTTPTASPQEMMVDYVLFGSKDLERDQQEKQKAAKEKRSIQTKELGAIDPEEQKFQAPAHPLGYSGNEEFQQLNAPAYLGVVYDQSSKQGIVLREIVPGGPAAQAGLLAGEVIVQAKYVPKKRTEVSLWQGPFYVYNVNHLEKLLTRADIKWPVQMRVVRGHGDMEWVPVMLTAKAPQSQNGPEMHIPGQEVQADADFKKYAASKSDALQQSTARQLFRPNEPSPARETGNNPANVSSLS